jgi:hypothetical protein
MAILKSNNGHTDMFGENYACRSGTPGADRWWPVEPSTATTASSSAHIMQWTCLVDERREAEAMWMKRMLTAACPDPN